MAPRSVAASTLALVFLALPLLNLSSALPPPEIVHPVGEEATRAATFRRNEWSIAQNGQAFARDFDPESLKRIPVFLPRFYSALKSQRPVSSQPPSRLVFQNEAPSSSFSSSYPENWGPYIFEQPLDHSNASAEPVTIPQRYWISTEFYRPGGPVIVLDGGETSGKNRLPFLEKGIVDRLARETGGVGVILEHRRVSFAASYYGESLPPFKNYTVDELRWLTNEQALEDSARFIREAGKSFPGIDADLSAPGTPWIYYGGSYAGARAAHMRVLYPDIVFGAIASSGVVHAFHAYPEYMELIGRAAPIDCSKALQESVQAIDNILSPEPPYTRDEDQIQVLKELFGLGGVKDDRDFVHALTIPLGSFQAQNWDEDVSLPTFARFCQALVSPAPSLSEPDSDTVDSGGEFAPHHRLPYLPSSVLSYAAYIRDNVVAACLNGEDQEDSGAVSSLKARKSLDSSTKEETDDEKVEKCFGSQDKHQYEDISAKTLPWRAWLFQVCTQWGYFFTSPLNTSSSRPRIVSKLLDLNFAVKPCRDAFPPGEHFQVPELPNISSVNDIGDFAIRAKRLAFVDGEFDPWRPATAHSEQYAQERTDTLEEPYKLIPDCWHHCDENGLHPPSSEPPRIQDIHAAEVAFVKSWLEEWETKAVKA